MNINQNRNLKKKKILWKVIKVYNKKVNNSENYHYSFGK